MRVDAVVLPPWAQNNHHFIYINYMALEHGIVRENINKWIDLIFGIKQQDIMAHNLFKPLTSEVLHFIILEICSRTRSQRI